VKADELWSARQGMCELGHDNPRGRFAYDRADHIVAALAPLNVPDMNTILGILSDSKSRDSYLGDMAMDIAAVRKMREAIPLLVELMDQNEGDPTGMIVSHLTRIGDVEAVRLSRARYASGCADIRFAVADLLSCFKSLESEEAALALLEAERDIDCRRRLCTALCRLFSQRGTDAVRRFVAEDRDDPDCFVANELFVAATVLGQNVDDIRPFLVPSEGFAGATEDDTEDDEDLYIGDDDYDLEDTADEDVGDSPPGRSVHRLLPKVGRNEPCPCGSGLKYKKCCGRNL